MVKDDDESPGAGAEHIPTEFCGKNKYDAFSVENCIVIGCLQYKIQELLCFNYNDPSNTTNKSFGENNSLYYYWNLESLLK